MTKLSDEQREELKAELAAIEKAQKPLREARKPIDDALAALDAVIDATLERYGAGEAAGQCESCEVLLFEGDMGHQCGDGPKLCAECSPTWRDLKNQCEGKELPTDTPMDLDDEFEDGVTVRDKLAAVEAHVAGGGSLDDKIVHPL